MPRVPASQAGYQEATRQVARFAEQLLGEASSVAKRNESEEASAAHVRRAANHLYSSGTSRRGQVFSSVGGVMAGAAASSMVTFMATEVVNVAGIAISAASLVVGAVLLAVGLMTR